MSVVPVSKDLHVDQEMTILIPTKIDNTNNVQREKNSNWSKYDWVVYYSLGLALTNFLVLTCLYLISLVQMNAWEDELRNLTNSTTVIQYETIHNSLAGSILITYLIIKVLFVAIIGLDTIIKSLREITLKRWIFMACLTIIIVMLVSYATMSTPRLKIFVKKICKKMVFSTDINGNLSLTLPQNDHLPPGLYYLHLCMMCLTILFNIQHIIMIFLIAKIRPKDSSNPSSRSSTTQTQKISKKVSKPKIAP